MTTYTRITDTTHIPAAVVKALSRVVLDELMKHQHVAIATLKGRVVAVGTNTTVKTHPLQARNAAKVGLFEKQYLHAELAACLKARGKYDIMWVVRLGKCGQWLLSKPCKICQIALDLACVSVYYS